MEIMFNSSPCMRARTRVFHPCSRGALRGQRLLQNRTFVDVLAQLCANLCSICQQNVRYALHLPLSPAFGHAYGVTCMFHDSLGNLGVCRGCSTCESSPVARPLTWDA